MTSTDSSWLVLTALIKKYEKKKPSLIDYRPVQHCIGKVNVFIDSVRESEKYQNLSRKLSFGFMLYSGKKLKQGSSGFL